MAWATCSCGTPSPPDRPVSPTTWSLMAPAVWISSAPGRPMISCNCMIGFRFGGGIGPSFFAANCARPVVPVFGLTSRFAIGVVVKNGWAYRSAADGAPPDLPAAWRARPFWRAALNFWFSWPSINLPKMRGVLDVQGGDGQCRQSIRGSVPVAEDVENSLMRFNSGMCRGHCSGPDLVRSARPNRSFQYLAIATAACSAALSRPAVRVRSVPAIMHL